MNTSSLYHSQPFPHHVTPSKEDFSLQGHDFSFLDDIDSSTSCNPMDANPMDGDFYPVPTKEIFQDDDDDDADDDDKIDLERQLYETRRQLEEMRKDRDQGVALNHQLAHELGRVHNNLHQERAMHESTVQHLLQQQKASNERAFQSFLSFTLPKNVTLFPTNLSVDSEGSLCNYMIGATLGTGTFGSVVRASHVATKKTFAIKIVDGDTPHLSNEVQSLLRLRHVNVVRLYDYVVDDATCQHGLVMEQGVMDLRTYLDLGNVISLDALREITLASLKAIQYIHSQGVCHMDIKPENILLTKKKRGIHRDDVRLCDFGLCTMADPGTRFVAETNMKGTHDFFAPEMADFVPYNANAADMWSYGCTILDLTDEMPKEWKHSYVLYNDTDDIGRHGFKTGLRRLVRLFGEEDYFSHNAGFAPAFDLMGGLLKMKPQYRLTATQALQHAWLQE